MGGKCAGDIRARRRELEAIGVRGQRISLM